MRAMVVVLFTLFCCLTHVSSTTAADGQGRAYFDAGVFAFEEENFGDALQNLSKATELEPVNPLYFQYLGRTYMQLKRYDDAMSALSTAMAENPDLSGLTYDLALLHLKREEYVEAAALFDSLLLLEPDYALAQYYIAISLFKLERYQAALPHFRRAIKLSPSIRDNGSYYIGVCHLMLQEYDQARALLLTVRDTAADENLRQNAANLLTAVEKKKPWRISLEGIGGHDDNVKLEPDDKSNLFTDEGDAFAGAYLQSHFELLESGNYRVGIDYRHWQIKYRDLDEYDKAISFFQLSTAYRWDRLVFGINFAPSFYWLNGEGYGLQQEIEPVAVWEIDSRRSARFSYSRAFNNYFDFPEREGHTDTAQADFYQIVLQRKGLIYGGVALGRNTASHKDHEYDALKAALGLYVTTTNDFRMEVEGSCAMRDHRFVDSTYGLKREDRRYYLAASVSHPMLSDWLSIGLKAEYVRNDSNIDEFQYRKLAGFMTLVAAY